MVAKGMKMIVYKDYQDLKEPEGLGLLMEKVRDGLPFTGKDGETYSYQRWEVLFLTGKYKGRRAHRNFRLPAL